MLSINDKMGDEDQYREIYRMLLLQLALHLDSVKITDLAEFVVKIQKEVVRRDEEEALERLKNSLIRSFREAATDTDYISEEEFVNCMLEVDKRAPSDHYERFLKRTFEGLKSSPLGIKFSDYVALLRTAFDIEVDSTMERDLKLQLGEHIDYITFKNLNSRFSS